MSARVSGLRCRFIPLQVSWAKEASGQPSTSDPGGCCGEVGQVGEGANVALLCLFHSAPTEENPAEM